MSLNPLPFRLGAAGWDTAGLGGIESVSYRVDGLLHLGEQSLTLEWTRTQTVEQFSFEKIGTAVDELPMEWRDLPIGRLTGAWVIGGWWWPRMELRARGFEDFEGVPSARGVTLRLRIQRRDRGLARAIAVEIDARIAASALAFEDRHRLGSADAE